MSLFRTVHTAIIFFFTLNGVLIMGRDVLNTRGSSLRSTAFNANIFQNELNEAMGEALGCGGHINEQQITAIEQTILPVYRVLTKNDFGYIERRSLRFLAYRYFMKKSQLLIRGFEPSSVTNSSSWGNADILSQRVPAYVESVLQSKHAQEKGFNLRDAALMVATLEQLILDSDNTLLELVYSRLHKSTNRSLNQSGVEQLLDTYMVHWILGADSEYLIRLMATPRYLHRTISRWEKIADFIRGQVKTMKYQREHMPQIASRPSHNVLSPQYSFEDVHSLVGGITKSFGFFWEAECMDMKASLAKLDPRHTGRVPLSKFYETALGGDTRFGESEAYLRELGALDETSSRGKQVIIPNYVQSATNCFISGPYYMVCCLNECEAHINEIEVSIGAPTAPPSQILALVSNMSSTTTFDDDESPHLEGVLTKQLEDIARVSGGQVPLTSRLFAQWLHYVFPRECALPHKMGSAAATPLNEFGTSGVASDTEKRMHATNVDMNEALATMDKDDSDWMSQWSIEEELAFEEPITMHAPWDQDNLAITSGSLVLLGLALMGAISFDSPKVLGARTSNLLPTHSKAHFV